MLWCVIFSHFLWGNGIGGVIYWVEIGEIKPQVKYTPTNHYSNPKLGQNFTRESVVPPLVPFGHSKSTHRFESEIICTTALYMGEIFLETQNRILDPHRGSKVSNSGFNGLKSSKLALYRRKKIFAESLSMGHNSWKWVTLWSENFTLWSEKTTLWSKKSLYGVKNSLYGVKKPLYGVKIYFME